MTKFGRLQLVGFQKQLFKMIQQKGRHLRIIGEISNFAKGLLFHPKLHFFKINNCRMRIWNLQ